MALSKPMQNGFAQSFKGRLRDGFLNEMRSRRLTFIPSIRLITRASGNALDQRQTVQLRMTAPVNYFLSNQSKPLFLGIVAE